MLGSVRTLRHRSSDRQLIPITVVRSDHDENFENRAKDHQQGPDEVYLSEAGAMEGCASKISPRKVGASEISSCEVGVPEVDPVEVCACETGLLQAYAPVTQGQLIYTTNAKQRPYLIG